MPKSSVGIKTHFPGFIEPALATAIDKAPRGERWIHEIKSAVEGQLGGKVDIVWKPSGVQLRLELSRARLRD